MNFDDTPEEAAFRAEARSWLDANAPKHLGPLLANLGFADTDLPGYDFKQESKAWQKKKYDSNWACLAWPKEYGGRGATPIQRVIWNQEEGVYGKLSGLFTLGFGMCGPTIIAWSDEETKRKLLPPMAAGEEIWCQLFSEPGSGSDLAGLRTRAEKDGDHWIINGQKIWTSGAHNSQYGLIITRTDPTVAKHKGLTAFWLRMDTPGVKVVPIKQGSGHSGFNEVYFDNVRIPDTQRVGPVGEGWKVSLTTLMNERLSIGGSMSTGFPDLLAYAQQMEMPEGGLAINDRAVRSRLAVYACKESGLKYTAMRAYSALSQGKEPGPENSIGKLVAGATMQELATYALDLMGQTGAIQDPKLSPYAAKFQAQLLRSPGTRIEGGTDEILRNIIGERVLGLPEDMRADKGLPFNKIPTA